MFSAIPRAPRLEQNPRFLQEKATRRSKWQFLLGSMAFVGDVVKGILAWRQHTDSTPTAGVSKQFTVEQSAQVWDT